MNVSTQLQTRPLIYPSELQKLNRAGRWLGPGRRSSWGPDSPPPGGTAPAPAERRPLHFPLKTKYTPSYLCPLYQFGEMDLTDVRLTDTVPSLSRMMPGGTEAVKL